MRSAFSVAFTTVLVVSAICAMLGTCAYLAFEAASKAQYVLAGAQAVLAVMGTIAVLWVTRDRDPA